MSLENLVSLAVPAANNGGLSLSRAVFNVVLKSPNQTACVVVCRAINENPSIIIEAQNGGGT